MRFATSSWHTSLCLIAVFIVSVGCSSSAKRVNHPPASAGVQQFVAALRSDNPRVAYKLLATKTRKQIPYTEFAALWKKSKSERQDQAKALEEGLKEDPNLGERSKVVYADGKSVMLLRERGLWKLESALVSEFHASTARDAVQVFAAAMANRNYDAAMRILSSRRRKAISRQVDAFVTSLITHISKPGTSVTMVGKGRAEIYWESKGKRYKLVIRREGDEWRIDDIHMRAAPAGK